jgi:hypothetical protein
MNQTFTLSLFAGIGDTRPRAIETTWAKLCLSFAKPRVREEKDGLLFSPARYRAPRRLITNVIELSLLVLEVDGAWRCDDCGHQGPLVMFRNRRHEGDRCPACKKRNKKLETSNVIQIEFDLPALIIACRSAYPSAFALYSTHGHLRTTETNPLAEPRFRIVIPLTEPVPVADFLELWYAAVESLKEIPADPQVKDPNRIYYTPVKFSETSVYEFHVEPGEPLDWRKFVSLPAPEPPSGSFRSEPYSGTGYLGAVHGVTESAELFAAEQKASEATTDSRNGNGADSASLAGVDTELVGGRVAEQSAPSAVLSGAETNSVESKASGTGGLVGDFSPAPRGRLPSTVSSDIYASHESRHEELGRRIVARGKINGRGNYDARCLAHGGKGTTALFYNPRSGAVSCNKECSYEDLLRAEGLDDRYCPPASRVAAWQAATVKSPMPPAVAANLPSGTVAATLPIGSGGPPATAGGSDKPVTLAKVHAINALLLAHLFELSLEDEKTASRYWGEANLRAEEIEWPGTDNKQRVKVCSFPSRRVQLEAVKKLSQEFSLEGVPGFYRVLDVPGPDGDRRRREVAAYGPWRIALDQYRMRPGALLTPFDNGTGYICGLRIHRNVRDKVPFLLTSNGLPGGSKAVAYRESEAVA